MEPAEGDLLTGGRRPPKISAASPMCWPGDTLPARLTVRSTSTASPRMRPAHLRHRHLDHVLDLSRR
jgi:hypothetical protein